MFVAYDLFVEASSRAFFNVDIFFVLFDVFEGVYVIVLKVLFLFICFSEYEMILCVLVIIYEVRLYVFGVEASVAFLVFCMFVGL